MSCRNLAQRRNHSLVLWNDRFADTKPDTGVRTGDRRGPQRRQTDVSRVYLG